MAEEKKTCIRMDYYWNFIATPMFLIVVGFGLYTIFSAYGPATAPRGATLGLIRDAVRRRVVVKTP
jgi:hypothetical protein